jgi:Flp pilus assembly protein TadB
MDDRPQGHNVRPSGPTTKEAAHSLLPLMLLLSVALVARSVCSLGVLVLVVVAAETGVVIVVVVVGDPSSKVPICEQDTLAMIVP